MRNERKSISLLGWIIGALLLIYLGVFCYLNLCKYAQHVDSDIAAEALLAREIWVEKDITPNDWISSTERRIIGMPTVAAVFYGITGSSSYCDSESGSDTYKSEICSADGRQYTDHDICDHFDRGCGMYWRNPCIS